MFDEPARRTVLPPLNVTSPSCYVLYCPGWSILTGRVAGQKALDASGLRVHVIRKTYSRQLPYLSQSEQNSFGIKTSAYRLASREPRRGQGRHWAEASIELCLRSLTAEPAVEFSDQRRMVFSGASNAAGTMDFFLKGSEPLFSESNRILWFARLSFRVRH
jgi:hypothetical protein